MQNSNQKVFLVFNTTCIGDMLVTNILVQNIKYYYPNSKVVFICNTPFVDIAKYQVGVDEVISFDKKKDKTLCGIFNFIKNFPHKSPYASFVTYSNERNLLISKLLRSKHIISHHKCKFWNTKEKYLINNTYIHMMDRWAGLIEPLIGEYKKLPIKYNAPDINTPVVQKVKELNNPVVVSTTSNFYKKDMPVTDCIQLIHLLNKNGYTPILTGAGVIAQQFVANLKKQGCYDFINLVDVTSFVELANIMKICGRCISVDTGTLHFANALQVPVVGVFYAGCNEMWAPNETLYPAITLVGKVSPEEIFRKFNELCGEK